MDGALSAPADPASGTIDGMPMGALVASANADQPGTAQPPPLSSAASPQQQEAARKSKAIAQATRVLNTQAILASGGAAPPAGVPPAQAPINTLNQPQQGALAPPAGAQPAPPPQGALAPRMMQPQLQAPPTLYTPPERGWDVPMMAAAGAMLAPTRTGGFAESLGAGLTAAAAETQKQREMVENEALRIQQQQVMNSWHQNQTAVNQEKADAYSATAAARIPELQARSAYEQARAAVIGASHESEGDQLGKAVQSLVGTTNPDTGKPWTQADAYRYVKGIDVRKEVADANVASKQQANTIRQKMLDIATTREERERISSMTDEQIRLMNAGTAAGAPIKPEDAGKTVQQLRTQGGAPAPASAPAATPTTPAAPAAPEAPERPSWVPPQAQYSKAYKNWYVQTPNGKWAQVNAP